MSTQVADPKNPAKKTENQELVKFDGPKDSVYLNAKDYVELDVGTGKHAWTPVGQAGYGTSIAA